VQSFYLKITMQSYLYNLVLSSKPITQASYTFLNTLVDLVIALIAAFIPAHKAARQQLILREE
jgi:ABC-type lipoprotein release transport system permease subunit